MLGKAVWDFVALRGSIFIQPKAVVFSIKQILEFSKLTMQQITWL